MDFVKPGNRNAAGGISLIFTKLSNQLKNKGKH